ncbi:hypothetical protein V8E53_006168 [Lactarius tabidus]
MLFHVIAAVASVAFIAQGALAQQTVQDVVNNIDKVTQIAQNANTALSGATQLAREPQVKTSAKDLEDALKNIVENLNAEDTKEEATAPFTDCADADSIVVALSNVVGALRELLDTVIGKQSLFAQFMLLDPIATALQSLQTAIDSSAQPMINLLPACDGSTVINGESELDDTLGNAITLYKQTCIPSFDYPSVRPSCLTL